MQALHQQWPVIGCCDRLLSAASGEWLVSRFRRQKLPRRPSRQESPEVGESEFRRLKLENFALQEQLANKEAAGRAFARTMRMRARYTFCDIMLHHIKTCVFSGMDWQLWLSTQDVAQEPVAPPRVHVSHW